MRKFLLLICCIVELQISNAQTPAETHDFITYDTLYNIGYAGLTYRIRISRPRNLFTANHPDNSERPAIITMPGQGEMGTNYAKLQTYGPHFWLNNGWDGGVQLSNGRHYPILITMICSSTYPGARENYMVLKYLIDRYHIKANSVHLAGLSQGAFTWSSMIAYEETAGAETGMKVVTSLTLLEGTASELPNPYASWSRGFNAFGVWAQKYKGKLFGLEGTNDGRDVWRAQVPMNATTPGSAFFAFQNIGGGGHCCWNSMYDPSRTNFTSTGVLAPNIATNTFHPNSLGTYKTGDNIFMWMLKQGDTSLVGSTPSTAFTVNAGADQAITLPSSAVNLAGSVSLPTGRSVSKYVWTKVSGAAATITDASASASSVTGLAEGSYVFRLSVTNDAGAIATDDVAVTVAPAINKAPTAAAGVAQTIVLPVSAVTLTGTGTDSDGSIASYKWVKTSGGAATIVSASTASTQITGLVAGTYVFTVTVTDNKGATASAATNVVVQPAAVVTTRAIPGKFEAEAYDANYGVTNENTSDSGAGQNVGYIDANDWMDYAVNVKTAGNYKVNFRIASTSAGAKIQLKKADGTVLVTADVPSTGGYQTWKTISANVTLTAGTQTLRVFSVNSTNWNINWISFETATVTDPGNAAPENPVPENPAPVSTKIEAEKYSSMSGVQNEVTSDVNGGLNLGYIDFKDWMEYSINAPVSGTYTFNFRIAAPLAGAQFQVKKADGSVIATVNPAQTGGYQTWQTTSASITLDAGVQTLRIYSSSTINWNFNWLEFITPSGTATARVMSTATEKVELADIISGPASVASIYPNPATDHFTLKVVSQEKGSMSVQITDVNGRIRKDIRLNKQNEGLFTTNLSTQDLTKGVYIITIKVGGFSQIIKLLKS